MSDAIEIVPYAPRHAGDFHRLWVTWLRDAMGRQPQAEDLDAVDHPQAFYIDGGGAVFFAERDGTPVGVVAVRHLGEGDYEFCKLVVADAARGSGAGRALVERCIAFATLQGGRHLYLQSFRALANAVELYRRMGFVDCRPPPAMSVLARTEIVMYLPLDGSAGAG